MSDSLAGALQVGLVVALLAIVHVPLGDYMARVYSRTKDARVERGIYRVMGVDPTADQRWPSYLRSLLAFSLVGLLFLYAFQRLQQHLLLSLGFPAVKADQAWNTAASFITNTNWQSYSGESTMGYLVQMGGLAVQNFVSAAVGMAVAIALVRGFVRSRTDRLGNFWVDLTRGCLRILLPLSFVFAIVLIAGGVIQNFHGMDTLNTLVGGHQTLTGGPVASQEAIKEIGTNGGGFYNANSAHPFENPTAWTNVLEIFLLLAIPFSLPRTFGKLVGDKRQGYAIVAAMAIIWVASLTAMTAFEVAHHGTAPMAAGAAMEGKETRFGVPASTLFATSTTLTSTGAVNSFHDSFTALGGGMTIVDMMTGEVAPGGVGSGLYGILVLAVVAVFVAGLMVGRTPEYLGKKIRAARDEARQPLHPRDAGAASSSSTGPPWPSRCQRAAMLNPGHTGSPRCSTPSPRPATTTAPRSPASPVNSRLVQHSRSGSRCCSARFFCRSSFALGLAGSLARQSRCPTDGRHAADPHRPCSWASCSAASSSSSPASPSSPPWASRNTARGGRCTDVHPQRTPAGRPATSPRPQAAAVLRPARSGRRMAKLDPRSSPHNPVMLRRAGSARLLTTVLSILHPSVFGWGQPVRGLAVPVVLTVAVRQPGRGDGRGTRQGPGRDAARSTRTETVARRLLDWTPGADPGTHGRGGPGCRRCALGDLVVVVAGRGDPR